MLMLTHVGTETIGKHASFKSNDESQIVTEKSHFVTFQSNKGIVGGIYDRPRTPQLVCILCTLKTKPNGCLLSKQ